MKARQAGSRLFRSVLDFALPPRCGGCGIIVDDIDSFCGDCWARLDFLQGGCLRCGIPLKATDAETCGACLAHPPRLDRIRAAVAYGDISRSIALRLKYGRKTALARTMARYMRPLSANCRAIAFWFRSRCIGGASGIAASTSRRSLPARSDAGPESR
jgi:predicted amidophosphoribosyltransferase